MRIFNVRFFFVILGSLAFLTASLFLAHSLQSGRIARALLSQAKKAEDLGREEKAVRFLGRYLEFAPDDVEERAHLARLLAGEPPSVSPPDAGGKSRGGPQMRQRALFVLEQVLAREPNRKAERCLLVRIALDLSQLEVVDAHAKYLQEFWADDAEADYLIGRWQEARENFAEAANWYRQAVDHDPQQIDGYVRLANILRHHLDSAQQVEHDKQADQLINDLVAKNEDAAEAHLARWHYRRERGGLSFVGKLQEASQDVIRALELAPKNAEVLVAAAELAQAQDNPDKARGYLQTGLQLHPADARFYRVLAQLELRAGRRAEAVARYAQGAKAVQGRDRFHLLWDLANLLIDQGSDKEAAAAINQVKEIDPPPGAVDYLTARLQMTRENWSTAAQGLERVRPLFEMTPDLLEQVDLYLGRCYQQINEPPAQLAAFGRVLARDPSSLPARLGLAAAQEALGRTDEALEQYRQLMKLPGAPATGWIEIARLAILTNRQQRNWKEVEETLDRAEKAQPDAIEVPLLRAEALAAQGKLDQAREILTQARDRKPKQAEFWTALAALAERQGNAEEAAQILDKATEQIGDRVGLRLARARWWVGRRDPKAAEALNRLADDLQEFDPKDQAILLRGLAPAQHQAGHLTEARSLWTRLAALPQATNDLPLRLLLFELALQAGDEPAMSRLVEEMQRIEGPQGPVQNFCQALWLIQQAQQGKKEVVEKAQALLDVVAAQRPTWPAVPLAQADLEELRGKSDQVILNFRRALELGERNPRVMRRLVELLYQQQRYDEADQEIRKLQQQAPLEIDLQRLAVAVSLRNQDPARAVQLALQTVAANSKDYRDYLWLGRVMTAAGRPTAEAEKYLRRAVELADDVPETWLALVRYLAGANHNEEAEKVIDQARSRLPKEKTALALAQCYEAIGRRDRADHEYQAALSAQPNDGPVLRAVASYYLRTGRTAEAETLLRRVLEGKGQTSDRDRTGARRQLAMTLANQGECRRAFALLGLGFDQKGQVIEDKPPAEAEMAEELRTRAQVLAVFNSRSARAKAIGYWEELSRREALSPDDRLLLAQLLEMDGSWPKARTQIRNLVTSQNKNPRYLAYFAGCLRRHHELDDAGRWIDQLEQVEKAQRVEPGTFGTIELRAQLLEAQGKSQEALALLKVNGNSKSTNPERLIMLISSLARQKKWQEALDLCEAAWQSCPPEAVGGISVAVLRAARGNQEQCARVERRLRLAVQENPKAASLSLQLADLLELRDDAEAEYRRVLEQDSRNVRALNNLAWLLAQKSDKGSEALALINRAIEVAGPKSDLLDTRAVAYLALSESAAALADLQTAIADSPSGFRYFHLARAHFLAHNREAAQEAFHQATSSGLEPEQLHPAERLVYREMARQFEVQ
jgi:tetratricopeptide (TPR) repeat protein